MKPTEKQERWLRKYLPKDARPIDVVPRAYCVLKPALGCAAFAIPYGDLRRHPASKENALDNSGVIIDAVASKMVWELCQGDWVTVVYAEIPERSILWYCAPLIPLKLCSAPQ